MSLVREGRHHWLQRSRKSRQLALQAFRAALEADPSFAEAWVGQAMTYGAMAAYGEMRPDEAFARHDAAVERARALGGETAAILHLEGAADMLYRWDFAAAERALERSIALDSTYVEAHNLLANLYRALGRFDEALREARTAKRLDPLTSYYDQRVGQIYFCAGRDDEAVASFRAALVADTATRLVRELLVASYARRGMYDSALVAWREMLARNGAAVPPHLVAARGREGFLAARRAEATDRLAAMDAGPRAGYADHVRRATALALAGRPDEAFAELDRAVAERDPSLLYLHCNPGLAELRDDPRFDRVRRRVGLPQG